MDELRSKSYNDSRRQVKTYSYSTDGNGYSEPTSNPTGFRCYSASYNTEKEIKSSNGSVWSLNDPELHRKKRVATYKVYTVEGKLKGSIKNSFRWIKESCAKLVYGWR